MAQTKKNISKNQFKFWNSIFSFVFSNGSFHELIWYCNIFNKWYYFLDIHSIRSCSPVLSRPPKCKHCRNFLTIDISTNIKFWLLLLILHDCGNLNHHFIKARKNLIFRNVYLVFNIHSLSYVGWFQVFHQSLVWVNRSYSGIDRFIPV